MSARWAVQSSDGRSREFRSFEAAERHARKIVRASADDAFAIWANIDEAIRVGLPGLNGTPFLHRSLKPLADTDLRSWAERGQPDLFGNECEGMCGT